MGFSRTLPPTFLFLQSSIVKEPTSQTRCRGPYRFWLGPGRVSLTRLSWISQGRTLLSPAARRPRCEAYIVASLSGCQQRFRSFLNFLRQLFQASKTVSSVPQGQWFSTPLAAPQWSPIAAPLPAEDFDVLRGDALARCMEVYGEGKSGGRLAPSLTSPLAAGNCRGNKMKAWDGQGKKSPF
jgi:hypothetical protein